MSGGQTLLSPYSTHKDATQMGPTPGSIALWDGGPISKELSYNPKGFASSLLISFSTVEIFSQLIVICKILIIVQLLQIASINKLEQKEQVKYLSYNARLPN